MGLPLCWVGLQAGHVIFIRKYGIVKHLSIINESISAQFA